VGGVRTRRRQYVLFQFADRLGTQIMLRQFMLCLVGMIIGSNSVEAATSYTLPATVPYFSFTPTSGGPGTIVHLTGGQTYNNQGPISIYVSRVGRVDKLTLQPQPPSSPLATTRTDKDGNWTATITIPDRWSTGEPIAAGTIYVFVPEAMNALPFKFLPTALPPTGSSEGPVWIALVVIGVLMIAIGSRLVRHSWVV
jgi:hypothetical protein